MKRKKPDAPADLKKLEVEGEIEILSVKNLPPKSELRPVENLAKHGRKSGYDHFSMVEEWLVEAHHLGDAFGGEKGTLRFAIEDETRPKLTVLLNWFLCAVAFNERLALRRFADVVNKVHARAGAKCGGDCDSSFPFSVPHVDPALANLARNTAGTTIPTKAREIRTTLSDLGGPQISERTARRRRRDLGLKPGKPGRPRKV